MDKIWNEFELNIPPVVTIRVQDASFVKKIRSIFLKNISPQNNKLHDELANSAALLSRLMARRKNSFHNMNGFKCVCKLNSALGRLLKADTEQVLNNFFQTLPDIILDSVPHKEVPTRNAFDYILLRIISVHKLYQRIISCCNEAANYFNKLLQNNFFMDTIILFLAVIAKVWDLSHKIDNTYCDIYMKLFPIRNLFPEVELNTCYNYNFTKQLERLSMQNIQNSMVFTNDAQEDMNEQSTKISTVPVLINIAKSEDLGMAISRDSLKPVFDLSKIHNIEDIRKFFKEEGKMRAKSLNSAATKYILNHEWLAIQKMVERKIIANDHKKALCILRKFITSKI